MLQTNLIINLLKIFTIKKGYHFLHNSFDRFFVLVTRDFLYGIFKDLLPLHFPLVFSLSIQSVLNCFSTIFYQFFDLCRLFLDGHFWFTLSLLGWHRDLRPLNTHWWQRGIRIEWWLWSNCLVEMAIEVRVGRSWWNSTNFEWYFRFFFLVNVLLVQYEVWAQFWERLDSIVRGKNCLWIRLGL